MTTMDVQLTHDSPTPDETPYSYAGDDHLSEAEVVQSGWWSRAVKLSGKEKKNKMSGLSQASPTK